ncbi:hypothetical protein [Novosphingobium sp. 17-62-19]|uniref:hypothetical protein n=1 Tax=Novosphingobium sp. 17-62-19 TaxID=1970406 RepID=UPI0025EDAF88|nr:hypothetical protein [Novosphingobium sp. 17-62-19]
MREEGVYVIRKMTGNGGLPNCGPDTLRVDRVLVNDQDLGVKGLEGVLFTLMQGMQAMNIKPEESTREPIAQLKTVAPPSKKIDQYSQLAAMPRSAHPQSSSFSLIGVWAPEGEYCASGAPTTFRSDGKVVEEFGAGAWNINGEKLTILMNGETTKSTIRLISDDDIFAYWDEGGSTRYRRCPVTQDDEPWFPV